MFQGLPPETGIHLSYLYSHFILKLPKAFQNHVFAVLCKYTTATRVVSIITRAQDIAQQLKNRSLWSGQDNNHSSSDQSLKREAKCHCSMAYKSCTCSCSCTA